MDLTAQDEKALRAMLDVYHADPLRVIAVLYGVPLKMPAVSFEVATTGESALDHSVRMLGIARSIAGTREEPYSLPGDYPEHVESYLRMIRVPAAEAMRVMRRVAQVLIPEKYPNGPISGWHRPHGGYNAYAYDEDDAHVPLHDPRAVSYTLLGAIYKSEATHLLPLFVAPFDYTSIPVWEGSPETEPEHVRDYLLDIIETLRRLAVREEATISTWKCAAAHLVKFHPRQNAEVEEIRADAVSTHARLYPDCPSGVEVVLPGEDPAS